MRLTKNFIFSEFTDTKHTDLLPENIYYAVDNMDKVVELAKFAQAVRDFLNVPMTITSGVRCPKLNERVGGSKTSQHLLCEAIDFVPSRMTLQQAFDKIRKSDLQFGQLIIEQSGGKEWIHVSIGTKREVKKYDGKRYTIVQ